MIVKVSDVMRHVRNHFIHSSMHRSWTQQNGVLQPDDALAPGMWIAVTGDTAPRGVYQLDEKGGIPDLPDTTWQGTVYRLDPPADFIRLCGDIACWAAANPDPSLSGERLGQYSMNRRGITWQEAFAPALAPYRRMFGEVQV